MFNIFPNPYALELKLEKEVYIQRKISEVKKVIGEGRKGYQQIPTQKREGNLGGSLRLGKERGGIRRL